MVVWNQLVFMLLAVLIYTAMERNSEIQSLKNEIDSIKKNSIIHVGDMRKMIWSFHDP